MQVQALINEDSTEAALFFPDPYPGYTITMNAAQVDQLIGILQDLRAQLTTPPEMPGELPPTRQ